ncbi:HIT family protein [Candidatus Pacearchaeota archaeon]|nr:HIT family protein [Candidatus Pacearchaeota archaeon]|tara:strand:- start:12647 stop:13003 length:357 start_codon:yes stop_codon:yes gene_type:complete
MGSDENCIFCKIVKGEISAEKVLEGDSFIAIKDANPVMEEHTLVIPKQHWVTLLDIPNKFGNELLEFTKKVAEKLMDSGVADGFNVVMNNLEVAGQVVKHAHIHLIPRKEGDGIKIVG